jgi:hypothetical protein
MTTINPIWPIFIGNMHIKLGQHYDRSLPLWNEGWFGFFWNSVGPSHRCNLSSGRVGWIVSGRELGRLDSTAPAPLEQEIKKSRSVNAGKSIIFSYFPFHRI